MAEESGGDRSDGSARRRADRSRQDHRDPERPRRYPSALGITPVQAASIILHDTAGQPLPVGSPVRIVGQKDTGALVGFDGAGYLDTLKAHNTLEVTTPSGTCQANFDYQQGDTIPDRAIELPQDRSATVSPHCLSRRSHPLVLMLLLSASAMLMPRTAHAQVTCNATITGGINFGTIDPSQGANSQTTVSFNCHNSTRLFRANVAVRLQYRRWQQRYSGNMDPRDMDGSTSPPLHFQLYKDVQHTPRSGVRRLRWRLPNPCRCISLSPAPPTKAPTTLCMALFLEARQAWLQVITRTFLRARMRPLSWLR